MNRRRWQLVFVMACLALLMTPVARGQTLRKYVIGSGAAASAGTGVLMAGTIGQPLIGRAASAGTPGHAGAFGFWYTFPAGPLGVDEEYSNGVTGVSATLQVAPNPVTDFAEIRVGLPTGGHVTLKIFDAVGREHQMLLDDRREAGTLTFRLTTETLASGNYTVVLVANGAQRTTALRVIK
jgi:hypothetical protein